MSGFIDMNPSSLHLIATMHNRELYAGGGGKENEIPDAGQTGSVMDTNTTTGSSLASYVATGIVRSTCTWTHR